MAIYKNRRLAQTSDNRAYPATALHSFAQVLLRFVLQNFSLKTTEGNRFRNVGEQNFDHLDYLPSDNTALTRRAIKHSRIHAVVAQ